MIFLWDYHRISEVILCDSYWISLWLLCSCYFYDHSMGFLWDFNDISMIVLCDYYGISIESKVKSIENQLNVN